MVGRPEAPRAGGQVLGPAVAAGREERDGLARGGRRRFDRAPPAGCSPSRTFTSRENGAAAIAALNTTFAAACRSGAAAAASASLGAEPVGGVASMAKTNPLGNARRSSNLVPSETACNPSPASAQAKPRGCERVRGRAHGSRARISAAASRAGSALLRPPRCLRRSGDRDRDRDRFLRRGRGARAALGRAPVERAASAASFCRPSTTARRRRGRGRAGLVL